MMYEYYFISENNEKIDFSPFGEIVANKIDNINGHDQDIKTNQGINQIGNTITKIIVKNKTIGISGEIRGDLDNNRKMLLQVIKPQVKGFLYAKGKYRTYKIEVAAKKTPFISGGYVTQKFQISFYAPYPYWQIDKEQKADIRALIPLFRFPKNFKDTWKFSEYQRSEFINVDNNGNEKTGIKIVLTAKTEAKNPKILNVETGELIKLNYTMQAGEIITITTGYNNKRVQSNLKGNIFRNLALKESTFLQLNPGKNIFKFTADVNQENIEVLMYFSEIINGI